MNLIRRSCGSGFCGVYVFVRVCACVCVSRPLWSPLIPNLTDLLQRQPLMCAESLFGISDAASTIFTSYSLIRNTLFCLFPHGARFVQQDRWLPCYEFVYNSGVFSPVLWSVILHLWARLIPFLSCVSLLIFDPNLKPPHRMGQRGLRRVVFLTFKIYAYICQRKLGSSSCWFFFFLMSRVREVLIAIYFYLFVFYCSGLDLNPACF